MEKHTMTVRITGDDGLNYDVEMLETSRTLYEPKDRIVEIIMSTETPEEAAILLSDEGLIS